MEFSIICVDDEEYILSSLRRLFRSLECPIYTFNRPEDALASDILKSASLIVSDMRMPDMPGNVFLEKSREINPSCIRVLLTGYSDMNSTIDAVNKGSIWKYVQKPWDDALLLSIMRDAIKIKTLEFENKKLQDLTFKQNEDLKELNASLEMKVEERTVQLKDANLKLKQNFMSMVKVFSSMIELKDKQNAGHCARSGDLSRRAAIQLNLSSDVVNDVFLAGLLHDIGSQGIPDSILNKDESILNKEERALWSEHPARGERILMSIPELNNAAKIIRQHHEQWDGHGFPDKLKGENIGIGARILSAAIEYDLLVSGKSTGRKETSESAARLLVGMAEHKLCPLAVESVIAALGTKVGKVVEQLIDVINLTPGMVLSRDLKTGEGILLLSSGHVLDQSLINKLIDSQQGHKKLQMWIKVSN